MAAASQGEVTIVLDAIGEGSQEAMNRLFELVYDELQRIARRIIGPNGATQPTVIVHEAYIKLFNSKGCNRRSARWRGGMEVDGGFGDRGRVGWLLFLFDGCGTPTIGR